MGPGYRHIDDARRAQPVVHDFTDGGWPGARRTRQANVDASRGPATKPREKKRRLPVDPGLGTGIEHGCADWSSHGTGGGAKDVHGLGPDDGPPTSLDLASHHMAGDPCGREGSS